ncbi:MAG: nucleotidyltransferase domain-containing protein [Bifidobacteriaceae bacterium]|jgi:predicted nucleotidyltransferase|nr:nucleotidyltransferase domain-containing protein [Bifidobacteriaceae bacterium]
MSSVDQEIESALAAVELERCVQVLYAAEAGSRAWGFSSPDSDWDVRFVYRHDRDHYLRLDRWRDVIEWMLGRGESGDVLDVSGWDLAKALRLLHGSKPRARLCPRAAGPA